jgi:hypothetical protein
LFISVSYFAKAGKDSVGYRGKVVLGKPFDVSNNESQLKVTFHSPAGTTTRTEIKMVVNGDTLTPSYIDSTGTYLAHFPAGTYQFVFLHDYWYPVPTSDLNFIQGKGIKMDVYFEAAPQKMPVILFEYDKPVIYLYPTEKTEVEVKLDVHGTLGFTYPPYNDGWKVTAFPNGDIESNGKKYNYLFWDATTDVVLVDEWNKGFVIEKDSLLSFFENTLSQMNLTPAEQQDFITYWIPRMMKNEKNFIHFSFNQRNDILSPLHITPYPETVFRVYMTWHIWIENVTELPEPQKIQNCTRNGFTIIEWGGSEFKNHNTE